MADRSNYSAPSSATVTSSVRFDSVVHERLIATSRVLGVSMNSIVNDAVAGYLVSEPVKARILDDRGSLEATIRALTGE